MHEERSINERIVVLENSLQSMTSAIAETNRSIEKTNDSIGKLGTYINDNFSELHEKLADKGKPNWSLLITGISVFSGLFFTLLTLRVEPIKSDIDSINKISTIRQEALERTLERLTNKVSSIDGILEWKAHLENESNLSDLSDIMHKLPSRKGLGPNSN